MLAFTLLTTLVAAGVALAQDYTINTPAALIQCQPANINWSGGKAPYILAVIPGGQPSAAALETLADGTSDTTYVWTVSLAEGTSITLRLTDSEGDIVYSSPVTIQAGSSTDCLNASATSAAGAAGITSGGSSISGATATGASASASSAVGAASSSLAGASASVSSMISSAASGASSAKSAASSAVQSASSRAASASSSVSGSSTPVSSGASASSSAPNGAMSNAAPGVFLAALGGLAALL